MCKYKRASSSLNPTSPGQTSPLASSPLASKITTPNSKDFIKCDLECCTNVFFKWKYTKDVDIYRCIKSYWRSSEVLHSRKARRLTSNLSWSVKGCRNNKICMKNIEIMRTSNLNEKLMCFMIKSWGLTLLLELSISLVLENSSIMRVEYI